MSTEQVRQEKPFEASTRDRLEIRDLIENWVLWRDSGDWDRFSTVWHEDGRMIATWFQATAADFIARSKKAFEAGMVVVHSLGGSTIDVQGNRAVAQTRMQITQRGAISGIPVDVVCQGRFIDALERRNGRWGLVLRSPVYDLDRISPLDPSVSLTLDSIVLDSFPAGYRHLAYLQSHMGFDVNKTLPGARGPAMDALKGRMSRWLAGCDSSCLVA